MKRLISLVLLTLSIKAFAQINTNVNYNDYTRTVYWFDIGVRYQKEKSSVLTIMKIIYYGKTIKYGNVEQFSKHLWNNLSIGKGIAVGPFNTYQEAKFANQFYNLKKQLPDSIKNNNNTFYWYLVKVKRYKRMHSLAFERMAARVAAGNISFFLTNIQVALPNNEVPIGPFTSYEEAEFSKMLFRIEE